MYFPNSPNLFFIHLLFFAHIFLFTELNTAFKSTNIAIIFSFFFLLSINL